MRSFRHKIAMFVFVILFFVSCRRMFFIKENLFFSQQNVFFIILIQNLPITTKNPTLRTIKYKNTRNYLSIHQTIDRQSLFKLTIPNYLSTSFSLQFLIIIQISSLLPREKNVRHSEK